MFSYDFHIYSLPLNHKCHLNHFLMQMIFGQIYQKRAIDKEPKGKLRYLNVLGKGTLRNLMLRKM